MRQIKMLRDFERRFIADAEHHRERIVDCADAYNLEQAEAHEDALSAAKGNLLYVLERMNELGILAQGDDDA